jgi:ABC-2 type transport system permease protein
MNPETAFTIAAKELRVLSRKRSIFAYIVIVPLLLTVSFSSIIQNQVAAGNSSTLPLGLDSLTFFFVVLAAMLPSSIAAYSVVGEKIEKSLEPLLATPTTDGEVLLGKSIAAFVPPILSIWAGASIFMAAMDYITHNLLSYDYFPNWDSGVMLLLLAPLAAVFSIELTVIVSSRVSDVRSANQIGLVMFVPFMAFFFLGAEGIITFGIDNLLILSGVVLVSDLALSFLSTSTFNREEILTKWK